MGLAHRFQIGFNMAKVRSPAFQGVDGNLRVRLNFGLIRQSFGPLEEPLLLLFAIDVVLERVVFGGDFGLFF